MKIYFHFNRVNRFQEILATATFLILFPNRLCRHCPRHLLSQLESRLVAKRTRPDLDANPERPLLFQNNILRTPKSFRQKPLSVWLHQNGRQFLFPLEHQASAPLGRNQFSAASAIKTLTLFSFQRLFFSLLQKAGHCPVHKNPLRRQTFLRFRNPPSPYSIPQSSHHPLLFPIPLLFQQHISQLSGLLFQTHKPLEFFSACPHRLKDKAYPRRL